MRIPLWGDGRKTSRKKKIRNWTGTGLFFVLDEQKLTVAWHHLVHRSKPRSARCIIHNSYDIVIASRTRTWRRNQPVGNTHIRVCQVHRGILEAPPSLASLLPARFLRFISFPSRAPACLLYSVFISRPMPPLALVLVHKKKEKILRTSSL
jgi:hypothetical protein